MHKFQSLLALVRIKLFKNSLGQVLFCHLVLKSYIDLNADQTLVEYMDTMRRSVFMNWTGCIDIRRSDNQSSNV